MNDLKDIVLDLIHRPVEEEFVQAPAEEIEESVLTDLVYSKQI